MAAAFCVLQSQSLLLPLKIDNGAAAASVRQSLVTASRRRSLLLQTANVFWTVAAFVPAVAIADPAAAAVQDDVRITLTGPSSLGVELMEVTLGTPPRTVAAVRRIAVYTRENALLQAGMILPDFPSAIAVQERLKQGPYPVTLSFRNLAAGGDAISDAGTPIVTAQDALDLAKKTSGGVSTASGAAFEITTLRTADALGCNIRSRRGDVLEIVYDAHYGSAEGPIYDSSIQRGTGQPYQMVLGSGDMLPGVDQGLYAMCPGDARGIQIPPQLAYGTKGNRMFQVPPNTPLYWKVKLVSVNSVRPGDTRTRDEIEGRD